MQLNKMDLTGQGLKEVNQKLLKEDRVIAK
jgi:hypothetical protein